MYSLKGNKTLLKIYIVVLSHSDLISVGYNIRLAKISRRESIIKTPIFQPYRIKISPLRYTSVEMTRIKLKILIATQLHLIQKLFYLCSNEKKIRHIQSGPDGISAAHYRLSVFSRL